MTKEKTQRLMPKLKIGILDESASISDDAVAVTAVNGRQGFRGSLWRSTQTATRPIPPRETSPIPGTAPRVDAARD